MGRVEGPKLVPWLPTGRGSERPLRMTLRGLILQWPTRRVSLRRGDILALHGSSILRSAWVNWGPWLPLEVS